MFQFFLTRLLLGTLQGIVTYLEVAYTHIEDTRQENTHATNLKLEGLSIYCKNIDSTLAALFYYRAQNLSSFFPIHFGAHEVPLPFLPDFFAPDPCTEHIAAAIKDEQLCLRRAGACPSD